MNALGPEESAILLGTFQTPSKQFEESLPVRPQDVDHPGVQGRFDDVSSGYPGTLPHSINLVAPIEPVY